MKRLLASLLLVFLAACSSVPAGTDCLLQDVRDPRAAAAHAYLAASLDPSLPVYLAEGMLLEAGLLGMTQKLGDHYLITLDPRLDDWALQMVLIHEWAHVLVWEDYPDVGGHHGVEWGEAYARVFRVWAGEDS